MAWGLGTEAPARAEAKSTSSSKKDQLRERGIEVPVTAAPPTARQRSRYARINLAFSVVGMVLGVRSGLRYPQRLNPSGDSTPIFSPIGPRMCGGGFDAALPTAWVVEGPR